MSVVNIGRSREPKRVINTTLISSSGVTWFKVRIRNTLLIPKGKFVTTSRSTFTYAHSYVVWTVAIKYDKQTVASETYQTKIVNMMKYPGCAYISM